MPHDRARNDGPRIYCYVSAGSHLWPKCAAVTDTFGNRASFARELPLGRNIPQRLSSGAPISNSLLLQSINQTPTNLVEINLIYGPYKNEMCESAGFTNPPNVFCELKILALASSSAKYIKSHSVSGFTHPIQNLQNRDQASGFTTLIRVRHVIN